MTLCCLFSEIFSLSLNDFRILLDQLMPDNLYISNRVHASLGVCVLFTWIGTHNMIQCIYLHHMRKKLIAKSKSLRSSLH